MAAAAASADVAMQEAPADQEWAEVLQAHDADLDPLEGIYAPPRGQVRRITQELEQDASDPAVFRVDGKDKSWFMQKGGVTFERGDPQRFRLEMKFSGGATSRFGDDYADLSRAEQHATINWLLMFGVARGEYQLTGYKDCKASGYYFLLHLNYRRTHWRIIGCPHNSELEDVNGKLFTCNPQDGGQFELPAREGQALSVEFADGELWLLDDGQRVLRGHWAHDNGDAKLPDVAYYPAILTPNCPTELIAMVK